MARSGQTGPKAEGEFRVNDWRKPPSAEPSSRWSPQIRPLLICGLGCHEGYAGACGVEESLAQEAFRPYEASREIIQMPTQDSLLMGLADGQ